MPDKAYFQQGWVVADLDRSIDQWLKTTEIGPFFVMRHLQITVSHRGTPSELDFSLALGQLGGMQVELIQQHNDTGSAYRDSVAPGTDAFHHICAITHNLDADLDRLDRLGLEIAHEGTFGPMRFVYVDTRPTIGCMTELLPPDEANDGLFAMVAAAGAEWDGVTDPVRTVN
jgi:hypothetical protein